MKKVKEDVAVGHTFEGVSQPITDAFFRGLDDVKHGCVVSIDATIAEGRRIVTEHQANKTKAKPTIAGVPQQVENAQPEKVKGPIYGIPGSEIFAWVKSWSTGNRLPEPKSRRIR